MRRTRTTLKVAPDAHVPELYFHALNAHFGNLHWWPAESTLEIIIGAVLTQNTNWGNVEKAVRNLAERQLIDAPKLLKLPEPELAELIRPSGYFRLKAQRLRRVLQWYAHHLSQRERPFHGCRTNALRRELLAINGVGPETADSILLYALRRPVFVVDSYTRRIMIRHQLLDASADYETMQNFFRLRLRPSVSQYNQFHALIVETGKHFCRPTPRCEKCPLRSFLPAGASTMAGQKPKR